MTREQEILRDKLYAGKDTVKSIAALKSYIKENEKIASGTDDAEIKRLIAQQNDELNREYKRLVEIRSKIDMCISTIDDSELRDHLTMRYLGHANVFQISDELHCSRRTVDRKHIDALDIIIKSGADKYLDY